MLKKVPDLTNLALPETLEVHPVYGLGVVSENSAAQRFALLVMSEKGQASDPWEFRVRAARQTMNRRAPA